MNIFEQIYEEVSQDITLNPAFMAWFKNSKVVDENGEPLKVYHGTKNKGITDFDVNLSGKQTDHGFYGNGIYFTKSKDWAMVYSLNIGDIHAVYLKIENPYIFNPRKEKGSNNDPFFRYDRPSDAFAFTKRVKKDNHDGIFVPDAGLYIVFSSNQIKSEHNNGTFDSNSSNIMESLEPKKPVNGYNYVDIDNHLTGMADSYKFITSMGNKVTVYFHRRINFHRSKGYTEGVELEFNVNGSIEEVDKYGLSRDTEILSGVIYTMLEYIKSHTDTIQKMVIHADKSQYSKTNINRDEVLNKNRRLAIYKKLINRYVGNEWNVTTGENDITLTKNTTA
jgi:hypothetical protein